MSKAADTKIAVITGGTSGIGHAVAVALSQRPDWQVYIVGSNEERGRKAVEGQSDIHFHKANVSQYQELALAFHEIHGKHGRLDFVFVNAGATESCNILQAEGADANTPPPEPDLTVVDVNVKGVLYTSYLATHYFRFSPHKGKDASLVITGSCGSLYPFKVTPTYCGTKRALSSPSMYSVLHINNPVDNVVGFTRSIALRCKEEGIRVNALCPGIVRTGLVSDEFWDTYFKPEQFCPMELMVKVTLLLVDGSEIVDSNGKKVSAGEMYGQTLETSGSNFYLREHLEFCDDIAKSVMVGAN